MRVIVLVGLALALGTSDAAAPTEPLRVNVKLVVRITPIDGPTRGVGFTGRVIGRGEHQTTGFSTDDSLCARRLKEIDAAPSITASASPLRSARGLGDIVFTHQRRVDVVVTSVEIDRIRLDVVTDRDDAGRTTREVRHLVLTEGEPHLLDVIEAPVTSAPLAAGAQPCRVASTTLELVASIAESEALEREVLDYDVWLTDHNASGREVTRHLTRDGRQGEQVTYRFQSLRWRLFDLQPTASAPINLDQSISGSIRGRVRADGTIDISLITTRDVAWLWKSAPGTGSTGDGGDKQFSVRPGEPVRIDLPPTRGSAAVPGPDGRLVPLKFDDVFGGHQMSLIVTVTRRL